MARLLIRGEWFDSVSSTAYWESEYEQLVAQQADALFPSFHLVPFKADVASEYGTAKADFALIDKLYRGWWVIEAELAHHSLSGHVLPQVQKLASGNYGPGHARYLHAQRADLDPVALSEMMKGIQPRVLVVVNSPVPKWQAELRRFDAMVTVLEIFRSGSNEHVLRLNGDYPTPPPDALSRCRWDRSIRRFLVVESPAALGSPAGGIYEIEVEGSMTRWQRIDLKDTVYLNPMKSAALPEATAYLLSNEGGRLVLSKV
jgi:hypothetical protein